MINAPKLPGITSVGKIDLAQVNERRKSTPNAPQEVFITKGWRNHGIRKIMAYRSGMYWYAEGVGRIPQNEVHPSYDEAYNRASRMLNALKAQYDIVPYWIEQITFCHPDYK